MLNEAYKTFLACASCIPNWENLSKSELANGYCDAEEAHDEEKRNGYYAALMCKYWYMIPYMYKNCKSLVEMLSLTLEDLVAWLDESLEFAFRWRRWRDPSNPLSKNPKGPEIVINRCIFSTQKRWYAYYNKDKRRINCYAYSLEESFEVHGDAADGYGVIDGTASIDYCHNLIQNWLDANKIMEALIVDCICYQDVFKATSKKTKTNELDKYRHPIVYTQIVTSFSNKKLIDHLLDLDDRFVDYFTANYAIDKEVLLQKTNKFKVLSRPQLANLVKKCMTQLKEDEALRNLLCC